MAGPGVISSFEAFVNSQLQGLAEGLVAEHRRLLLQAVRAEAAHEQHLAERQVLPRCSQVDGPPRRPKVSLGPEMLTGRKSLFARQARGRMSVFGSALPVQQGWGPDAQQQLQLQLLMQQEDQEQASKEQGELSSSSDSDDSLPPPPPPQGRKTRITPTPVEIENSPPSPGGTPPALHFLRGQSSEQWSPRVSSASEAEEPSGRKQLSSCVKSAAAFSAVPSSGAGKSSVCWSPVDEVVYENSEPAQSSSSRGKSVSFLSRPLRSGARRNTFPSLRAPQASGGCAEDDALAELAKEGHTVVKRKTAKAVLSTNTPLHERETATLTPRATLSSSHTGSRNSNPNSHFVRKFGVAPLGRNQVERDASSVLEVPQDVPSTRASFATGTCSSKSFVRLQTEELAASLIAEEKAQKSTKFACLPMWEAQACDITQDLRRGKAFLSAWHQIAPPEFDELHGRFLWLKNLKVASPSSQRRLVWDLVALGFVCHDAFFIPLGFIGLSETPLLRVLAWLTRLFWSLDMFASLVAGFEKVDGSFEGRLGPNAWRYLKTWLIPDTVLVTASWTDMLVEIPSSQERLIYCIQMARMLRLVRLVRIRAALSLLYARLQSERLALLAGILQTLCGVLVVVHVIACCWVGLGRMTLDGHSWVSVAELEEQSPWIHYTVAFHWSLTQFYGSMEMYPTNLSERVFAIGALLAGFFIATVFVSDVTSSMTRLHIITSQQSTHLLVLKRYLQEHGISRRLAARVQLNAKYAMSEQQRNVDEADVEMLQLVSEPLRVELHLEVYSPVLAKHPLFGRLVDGNPAAMRQVCHVAVSTMSLSKDDILFSRGEVPTSPSMLFLASGELKYTQDASHFQRVHVGEWACEAVLWTTWVYHGMLTASAESRIVVLDANLFQEIAGRSQTEDLALGPYAKEFVRMLNACASVRSDLGTSCDTDTLVKLAYPRASICDGHSHEKRKLFKKRTMTAVPHAAAESHFFAFTPTPAHAPPPTTNAKAPKASASAACSDFNNGDAELQPNRASGSCRTRAQVQPFRDESLAS